MNRKKFLRSLLGGSAFLAAPYSSYSKSDNAVIQMIEDCTQVTSGKMVGFQAAPIEKVKVGIMVSETEERD